MIFLGGLTKNVNITDETTLPGEVPSTGYTASDKDGTFLPGPIGITTYHYQGVLQDLLRIISILLFLTVILLSSVCIGTVILSCYKYAFMRWGVI